MHDFVQVRYMNYQEGLVDDVTLKELISANLITQFYRPSESRWVDVDHELIRAKSNGYNGTERRAANRKTKKDKPVGFISRLFRRKVKEKRLNAEERFEKGFSIMHTTSNYVEAILAFAASIELDPTKAKTYVNRGMERINNMQQAIIDYSKAIKLVPNDAKAYYMRGMLLWRLGDEKAISDLRTSAEYGCRLAKDFLNRKAPSKYYKYD